MTGCLVTLKPTFMKVRILNKGGYSHLITPVGSVVEARKCNHFPGYECLCKFDHGGMIEEIEVYFKPDEVEVVNKEQSHIPYIKIGSVSVMSAVGFMAFGMSVGLPDFVVLLTGLAFAVTNFCVLNTLISDGK
jgi:hypothetical protein